MDETRLFSGNSETIDVVSGRIELPLHILDTINLRQKNTFPKDKDILISTYALDRNEVRVFTYAGLLSTLVRENAGFERLLMYIAEKNKITERRYPLPSLYKNLEKVLLVPNGDYFSLQEIPE